MLTVDMEDNPGTLGQSARRIADAGVNIDMVVYIGTNSRLVVAAYDLEKARYAVLARGALSCALFRARTSVVKRM